MYNQLGRESCQHSIQPIRGWGWVCSIIPAFACRAFTIESFLDAQCLNKLCPDEIQVKWKQLPNPEWVKYN